MSETPEVTGRVYSPARIGNRLFPNVPPCWHCGAPIKTTNYALGPKVEHYDPDALFNDSVWWHCRKTVATPIQETHHG